VPGTLFFLRFTRHARYSPAMSRAVSIPEPVPESFSGLLERLTRSGNGTETGARIGARSNSSPSPRADSGLPSVFRSASGDGAVTRPLEPVTELKPGRAKMTSDCMPLSYENALRAHARYRPAPEGLEKQPRSLASDSVAGVRVSGREPVPADSSRERRTVKGREISRTPTLPMSAATKRTAKVAPAKTEGKPRLDPRLQAMGSGQTGSGKRILTAQRGMAQGEPKAQNAISPQLPQDSQIDGSSSPPARRLRSVPKRSQVSQPEAKGAISAAAKERTERRNRIRPESRSELWSQSRAEAHTEACPETVDAFQSGSANFPFQNQAASSPARQPGTRRPPGRNSPLENPGSSLRVQNSLTLDFKRSAVSMRLSEPESERLRQRAAESGLSVSAYMRSCVLEADHLRFQVKQALAEMRARTQEPDPPCLPAPVGREGGRVWTWLRTKTVAFFLGPWYAQRPNA
jgi:hypothetical protein